MFGWSPGWIYISPLRKNLSALQFQLCRLWSIMSCIVLDIELADKNVVKELGVFVKGKVQGYSFRPPKKYKPTKQAFRCTRILHRFVWNCGCLVYSELANILQRAVQGEYFVKEQKNARLLALYSIKVWKVRKIMTVPKFKISLMKTCGFARVTHSDTGTHFTVQSARQNCSVTGWCTILSCNFYIVKWIVSIYEFKSFKNIQSCSSRISFEILSVRGTWLIKHIILISEILPLTTLTKKENRRPVPDL